MEKWNTYRAVFYIFVIFSLPGNLLIAQQASEDSVQTIITEDTIVQQQTQLPDSLANMPETEDGSVSTGDEGQQTIVVDEDSRISKIRELISFSKIAFSIAVLFITFLVTNILVRLLDTFSERFSSYRLFIKRLVPIIRIVIWIIALYIVLAGIIAPSLETVITVTASVGIAVGFASQDILKNIFGGIMIILDRPFQVGDKIELGNYYGEVLQIGLRSSRIVTPDDSVVSIPNAEIMNKAVSNANSGALDCQVVAEIFLPARIDVTVAKEIALKAAYSSRYGYLKKPVSVIALNEIHEKQFVVKLRVKAYVLDIRYEFPFKSDMTEIILEELNRRKLI